MPRQQLSRLVLGGRWGIVSTAEAAGSIVCVIFLQGHPPWDRPLLAISQACRSSDRFTTLHAEIAAAIGTVAEAVLLPN